MEFCNSHTVTAVLLFFLSGQIPLDLSIPAIVENIQSSNPDRVFSGVQSCRKLLAKGRKPPLDGIVE